MRLKYGWFHLKLYCIRCFKIEAGAQLKPVLGGFKTRLKFINLDPGGVISSYPPFKRTVSVIWSDSPCKGGNAGFTTPFLFLEYRVTFCLNIIKPSWIPLTRDCRLVVQSTVWTQTADLIWSELSWEFFNDWYRD